MSAENASLQSLANEILKLKKELEGLGQIRSDARYVRDRIEIHDVIAKYSRAIDRHDWDMLCNEVCHPDCIIDYNHTVGSPRALAEFLEPLFTSNYLAHSHVIANHLCDVSGDTAHAETYCVTFSLSKDGKKVRAGNHRYIDRIEKRDGTWKLVLRRLRSDASMEIPTAGEPKPMGKWDRSDLSYERPLMLPPESRAKIK